MLLEVKSTAILNFPYLNRVRTGPGKPGKSWKKATGPGKSWKSVKLE